MNNYVLVVDDHPDVRQLIMDVLETMNVQGREAINGQEALKIVQESLPIVMVLDLMMPVMNGFTLLTQLYSYKPGRIIPVILLSGLADDDQMNRLPGVVGVLRKGSFSVEELRTMLRAAIAKSKVPTGTLALNDSKPQPQDRP